MDVKNVFQPSHGKNPPQSEHFRRAVPLEFLTSPMPEHVSHLHNFEILCTSACSFTNGTPTCGHPTVPSVAALSGISM